MIINEDSFTKLWNDTHNRRQLLGVMNAQNGGEYYYLSGVLDCIKFMQDNRVDKNESTITD